MYARTGFVFLVLASLLLGARRTAAGKITAGGKCAVAKLKAAAKKSGAKLACYEKAILKNAAVDPACLAKAEGAFTAAFAKAESKGGCFTTGDTTSVEAQVDACVTGLVTVLPPGTTTTTTSLPSGCSHAAPNTCAAPDALAPIAGDQGADVQVETGTTSKWFSVLIQETSGLANPLSYTATLDVPAGMAYDLFVYDAGNATAPDCNVTVEPGVGTPEAVTSQWADNLSSDDGHWIVVEVRYVSGTACDATGQWTLTIQGDTAP